MKYCTDVNGTSLVALVSCHLLGIQIYEAISQQKEEEASDDPQTGSDKEQEAVPLKIQPKCWTKSQLEKHAWLQLSQAQDIAKSFVVTGILKGEGVEEFCSIQLQNDVQEG